MKKLTLLFSICIISIYATAQNVFPTTGNTGINITSPTEALQVNGNLRVDSSMTVQDSIKVQGRTRTFELVVDGDSKFKGDVIMKQMLRVDGLTKLKGPAHVFGTAVLDSLLKVYGNAKFFSNATVNGNFKVDATTKLLGNVVMSGVGEIGSISGSDGSFLITGSDGTVYKTPITAFTNFVYQPIVCPGGDVPHPMWSNGLNKLYVPCPPVNVGIGTSDPEHKLDVRGDTYTTKISVGNFGASHGALISGFVQNDSQDLIELGKKIGGTDEEVKFKITNDGIVYSPEIIVTKPADFPDYVFDSNYELLNLDSLYSYIEKNGHLPNMPTAEEVKTEGINLADIQIITVEKIEELTLYTIEIKKENEEIKDENNKLKSETEELKEVNKELQIELERLKEEVEAIKESLR